MAVRPSLKELLKDVPREKLDQPCGDAHLYEIALSLTDWQSIAPFLGLTEADIEEIVRDHAKTRTQKIAMLRKWRAKLGSKAKYKKLVKVFWKLERADLAEEVCELLKTETSSSSSDEDGPPAAKGSYRGLDSYAEYLRRRYKTAGSPMFLTVQWPPTSSRKFFNLAVIGHETIQRGPIDEDLVRTALSGKIDDIMRRKSSIALEDIFKLDNRERKAILIEGVPGAGKSTLAWHICQKWESRELFQELEVVVFVHLQDSAIQSAKSMCDLLPVQSEDMRREVMTELQSCRGRNVLFVLDGWDEYSPGLQASSPLQQLICSPDSINMHFSSLIITSRPIASGELQRYASSRVEIIGFTSAEVKQYFRESIRDSQAVQKLLGLLRERPIIEASCYLPLNAAIVVHLFLALDHTLPHTLHDVFTSLVLYCIIRHRMRQAEGIPHLSSFSSLDHLPPDVQEAFNNICIMAFHGVMKNKATFTATDLRSFNLPIELSTLSLIRGVQSFTAFGKSVSYSFFHRLVQDLLAAYHVSKLPRSEQILVFNVMFEQPRLATVFQFYAAFTKFQSEGIRDVVARIIQKREKPLLVNLLHSLHEAQDVSLCEFVASHLDGELDLQGSRLSPIDCFVVGYFLSCVYLTTSGEFKVNLADCSLDDYKVSFLVRKLSDCSSSSKSLLTLNLSKNQLSDGGVICMAENLKHNNWLKTLCIIDCNIGDQGMMSLACALKVNISMEELDLSGNRAVAGAGLMALGEGLVMNVGLKTLNISRCGLGDESMMSLARTLRMNSSLEKLDLSGNELITGAGLMALGRGLMMNRGLKTLNISRCGLGDESMKSLAKTLRMNRSLEKLDLSGNELITGAGLMALGRGLMMNRGLNTLVLLELPEITDWKQFEGCLRENNNLTKLVHKQ